MQLERRLARDVRCCRFPYRRRPAPSQSRTPMRAVLLPERNGGPSAPRASSRTSQRDILPTPQARNLSASVSWVRKPLKTLRKRASANPVKSASEGSPVGPRETSHFLGNELRPPARHSSWETTRIGGTMRAAPAHGMEGKSASFADQDIAGVEISMDHVRCLSWWWDVGTHEPQALD